MVIPLKTSPIKFIDLYVSILNPLLNLRDREADVLTAFLKVYYANKNHPRVGQLLFSRPILRSIRESLNMSQASFNNHKLKLRRKGLLSKTGISETLIRFQPESNKFNITYALTIINPNSNGTNKNNKSTSL